MSDPRIEPLAKCLGLIESDLGHSLLIFNIKRQSVIALNLPARITWLSITSELTDKSHLAKNLSNWYKEADHSIVRGDVDDIVNEFVKLGLLVPPDEGGFLEGRVVKVRARGVTVAYESPVAKEYPLQWLKDTHPAAFTTVMFSDVWSPADDAHCA